ncbi:Asp-tRNA(Asn)/Glu-tRNA(Gln) amidotransferase subunit GatA [Flavisolibacter nicotianae]|uniref:Asp-tRNA(Asn)/Glu-tRNA(Gln) amidotransferase subunit GatA n=1 Tax=Flavisolibacter nicotianae TaxID=2364882 RepID=UPI000EAD712F|nr:Asp-tRNA(Asn)/Glu-tRNA(Gln) amidotransferase subunit GatA [Flavisolibacter nicotianae]
MFQFTSIEQYQADIHSGRTTCEQAVRHFLSRIEEQSSLNAFVEVFAEEALARAVALDRSEPKGCLHGVVIGIKDNICYKDHRVSAGSGILQKFTSLYSATAVQRLLDEGAILIGRQNCDEFGMGSTNENSFYGPALNPVDQSRVPGGSSGGSAAAVKAGLCMAALGSDTGGSVRLPADFCGVVGIKPSYGRVSRHGLIAYASSFDVIGVLANSVEDAARVLAVISGPDDYDSTAIGSPPEAFSRGAEDTKYRIAYFPEWINHPSIDPEISSAIQEKLQQLKEDGHMVEPVTFSLTDYIVPTYYVLTTAEASSNLSRYDGIRYGQNWHDKSQTVAKFYQQNRKNGFGSEVKRRIMLGTFVLSAGYYDAYYQKAQQVRQLLQRQTTLIFNDFDFIIAPNATSVAYKAGEKNADKLAMYMGDIFTVFANLTGVPAASLPVFKHSSNLPFGLQVLSSPRNEVSLQRFTHQLMQQ